MDAPSTSSLVIIDYKDPNYPCDCECHHPGSSVLHIIACCRDRSYVGICYREEENDRSITLDQRWSFPKKTFVVPPENYHRYLFATKSRPGRTMTIVSFGKEVIVEKSKGGKHAYPLEEFLTIIEPQAARGA